MNRKKISYQRSDGIWIHRWSKKKGETKNRRRHGKSGYAIDNVPNLVETVETEDEFLDADEEEGDAL